MTICIAAICQFGNQSLIVGASDRMVSTPLIGAEPAKMKLQVVVDQIVAFYAGSIQQQAGLLTDMLAAVSLLPTPPTVKGVAEVYAQQFMSHRRMRAERKYLAPLGLNGLTFLNMNLSPELTSRLITEMRECELEAEAIIAGVDATGTHIYTVTDPGLVSCDDLDGYAAIGVGEWHADSEFMFRAYTRDWSFARALFLVYSAKKRAEAAPDVGKETDVFYVYPGAPPGRVSEEIMKQLETLYDNTQGQQDAIHRAALGEMDKYVETIFTTEETPQETKAAEGNGSHEEGVREGAEEGKREGEA